MVEVVMAAANQVISLRISNKLKVKHQQRKNIQSFY